MLETRCHKIKLKPGSIERVREWAQTISRRRDEALATLRDETIVIESAFLDRSEHGDFLIVYTKAESFARAAGAVRQSVHAIDEYHRQFKRATWDANEKLELLFDLDRTTEIESV